MAAGEVGSKVVSDTLNGGTVDSTALTPTSGSRICGVDIKYAAPEVSMTGLVSDATGDNVTVYYKVAGKSGQTYPVSLTVFEATDA